MDSHQEPAAEKTGHAPFGELKGMSSEDLLGVVREMVIKEGVAADMDEVDRTVRRLLNIIFIQRDLQDSKSETRKETSNASYLKKAFEDGQMSDSAGPSRVASFRKFEHVPSYGKQAFLKSLSLYCDGNEERPISRSPVLHRSQSSLALSNMSLQVQTSTHSVLSPVKRSSSYARFNLAAELAAMIPKPVPISERLYPENTVKFPYVPKPKHSIPNDKKSNYLAASALEMQFQSVVKPKSVVVMKQQGTGIIRGEYLNEVTKAASKTKAKSKQPKISGAPINTALFTKKMPETSYSRPFKAIHRQFDTSRIAHAKTCEATREKGSRRNDEEEYRREKSAEKKQSNVDLISELLDKCQQLDTDSLQHFQFLLTMVDTNKDKNSEINKGTIGWIPLPWSTNLAWYYTHWAGKQKENYIQALAQYVTNGNSVEKREIATVKGKANAKKTGSSFLDGVQSATNNNTKVKLKFKKAMIRAKLSAYHGRAICLRLRSDDPPKRDAGVSTSHHLLQAFLANASRSNSVEVIFSASADQSGTSFYSI